MKKDKENNSIVYITGAGPGDPGLLTLKAKEIVSLVESEFLFGKKILITRSKEQSSFFVSKLIGKGAKPILCPIVSYELIEKEIYNKNIILKLILYLRDFHLMI